MYDPPLQTANDVHAFRQVIHYNQFPAVPAACNRSLILFDDAKTAGLGYTARLLGRALLVAVNEKRVLINAPHYTARWCGVPPYTLACHYEPWTHCPIPSDEAMASIPKWSHRSQYRSDQEARRGPDSVRISTSQIHSEPFFYKFHQPPVGEATLYELLFKPRAWVREAARCVMRQHGLTHPYVVLHVRVSDEKAHERGSQMPRIASYSAAATLALAKINTSQIFLQTATPKAVNDMRAWSVARGVQLVYTENVSRARLKPWSIKTPSYLSLLSLHFPS